MVGSQVMAMKSGVSKLYEFFQVVELALGQEGFVNSGATPVVISRPTGFARGCSTNTVVIHYFIKPGGSSEKSLKRSYLKPTKIETRFVDRMLGAKRTSCISYGFDIP